VASQKPQQKQAVKGHRAERGYWIAPDTGLRSRKHLERYCEVFNY
jgi:hypothetical protein